MRNAPTVGFETRSGIRASSTLRARIERYASFAEGGTNVCRVYDGESKFWSRVEQYDRAALTSESVIRDGYGAGLLYGVVVYLHFVICWSLVAN